MIGKFFLFIGIIAIIISFLSPKAEMLLYIGGGLIGFFILINFFRIFFKHADMRGRKGVERRLIEGY